MGSVVKKTLWVLVLTLSTLATNAAGAFRAERSIVCRTPAGYEINRVYCLLRAEEFTENSLRRLFEPYARMDLEGEWYMIVTSDARFWDSAAHPEFRLGSLHEGFVRPLVTDDWVAYFFRLGDNAFFQFGRAGSESRWVVMRGENVFNRLFGETELRLVGQDFIGPGDEWDCDKRRRSLVFTSPDMREEDLPEIGRYYARLGRVNGNFSLSIHASPEFAATYENVRFPTLETMRAFERKLLVPDFYDRPAPPHRGCSLNRLNLDPPVLEYRCYDTARPQPPIPTYTPATRIELPAWER
jgi:hypothetical protein